MTDSIKDLKEMFERYKVCNQMTSIISKNMLTNNFDAIKLIKKYNINISNEYLKKIQKIRYDYVLNISLVLQQSIIKNGDSKSFIICKKCGSLFFKNDPRKIYCSVKCSKASAQSEFIKRKNKRSVKKWID